jgi:hypothetical protein
MLGIVVQNESSVLALSVPLVFLLCIVIKLTSRRTILRKQNGSVVALVVMISYILDARKSMYKYFLKMNKYIDHTLSKKHTYSPSVHHPWRSHPKPKSPFF